MLVPTQTMCRDIRKAYQKAKVNPREYVRVWTGYHEDFALAWRNVDHHSTQVYMVQVSRKDGEVVAEHGMITTKCEFKKIGLARPTVKEVEAWQRLVGPL
jgi:hypothetical protein